MGDLFGAIAEFAGKTFGGNRDYKHQRELVDMNASVQREFAQNAYQYATQDMMKAGLNPMLAYQQGGAHASGGGSPMAMPSGTGAGVASAMQYMMAKKKNDAEVDLLNAQAAKERAATPGAEAESKRLAYEYERLVPQRVRSVELDNNIKHTQAWLASAEYSWLMKDEGKAIKQHFEANYSMLPAELRQKLADAALKEVEAKYYPWKLAAPLVQTAGSMIGGYWLGKGFSAWRHAKNLQALGPGMPGPKGGPSVFRYKRKPRSSYEYPYDVTPPKGSRWDFEKP